MIKKLILSVSIISFLVAGFLCFKMSTTNSGFTEILDYGINNKPVGQSIIRELIDCEPIGSLGEAIKGADLIVEGEVISEGKLALDSWPLVVGTSPDHELNMKDSVKLTMTNFKINRVLYGKVNTDVITIAQFGEPNTNKGEIKIKKGRNMVCFLRESHDSKTGKKIENEYASVSWENGFFDVTDKTYAFSNIKGLSAYDGNSKDEFINTLRKVIKIKKK